MVCKKQGNKVYFIANHLTSLHPLNSAKTQRLLSNIKISTQYI